MEIAIYKEQAPTLIGGKRNFSPCVDLEESNKLNT